MGINKDDKTFTQQVIELKRLISRFNPKSVVIDINGIGQPFGDEMVKETFDPELQVSYPAYGFENYTDVFTQQPRNCAKILYGIKANAQLNSDMHSATYAKIYSGTVNFLISEKNAKDKLIATKTGQKMKPEDRIKRLMPHELTSILINEMMNLKLKATGVSNQIAVERINTRMLKDKFSAFEMGVYLVSQLEAAALTKLRNRGLKRKLTFYKKGGG